jgi:hypothetical protein
LNSRRVNWEGYIICMGYMRYSYRILVGEPERRGHFPNPSIDYKIIVRYILKKQDGGNVDWTNLA